MENKLTDNDIKKALECCKDRSCCGCPCNKHSAGCLDLLTQSALDLINRQKVEIERLQEKPIFVDTKIYDMQVEVSKDVEEVKHGEWIRNKGVVSCCNQCGCCVEEGYNYPYCPMCGAKMDGERKENE